MNLDVVYCVHLALALFIIEETGMKRSLSETELGETRPPDIHMPPLSVTAMAWPYKGSGSLAVLTLHVIGAIEMLVYHVSERPDAPVCQESRPD